MLSVIYINLDSAEARRASISENLRRYLPAEVNVQRLAAFNAAYVQTHKIPGKIRSGEKGCFLSHKAAIKKSIETPGPVLILEDDALIGAGTYDALTNLIAKVQDNLDMIFTDVTVADLQSMLGLFQLRKTVIESKRIDILDTKKIDFASSTAYVLNDKSKRKLLKFLAAHSALNVPYDLVLKALIMNGDLSSGFAFPFLTTLSSLSSDTQIQLDKDRLNNLVWESFRKLMFFETGANVEACLADIRRIPDDFYDEQATAMAAIVQLILAKKFTA